MLGNIDPYTWLSTGMRLAACSDSRWRPLKSDSTRLDRGASQSHSICTPNRQSEHTVLDTIEGRVRCRPAFRLTNFPDETVADAEKASRHTAYHVIFVVSSRTSVSHDCVRSACLLRSRCALQSKVLRNHRLCAGGCSPRKYGGTGSAEGLSCTVRCKTFKF